MGIERGIILKKINLVFYYEDKNKKAKINRESFDGFTL